MFSMGMTLLLMLSTTYIKSPVLVTSIPPGLMLTIGSKMCDIISYICSFWPVPALTTGLDGGGVPMFLCSFFVVTQDSINWENSFSLCTFPLKPVCKMFFGFYVICIVNHFSTVYHEWWENATLKKRQMGDRETNYEWWKNNEWMTDRWWKNLAQA